MKKSFLIFGLVLFFYGCDKSENLIRANKEILSNYTKTYEDGEVFVTDINYNNSGQIMEIQEYLKYDTTYYPDVTSYYYSNDRLDSLTYGIFDIRNYFQYHNDSIVQNFYHKMIIHGSGDEFIIDEKYVYILENNKIKEQRNYYKEDSIYQLKNYILFYWENDNLVKNEYYSPDFVMLPEKYFVLEKYESFEYDSLRNPFKPIAKELNWFNIKMSQNNVTRKIKVFNMDTVRITNYAYDYNELGLIISSETSFDENFDSYSHLTKHDYFYIEKY